MQIRLVEMMLAAYVQNVPCLFVGLQM